MLSNDEEKPRSTEGGERLTVKQAAALTNTCEAYVQWLIQQGSLVLKSDEKGARYLSRTDVQAYLEQFQKREAALVELVQESQALGLYDLPPARRA
jgi:Helix-turn-helix domain